MQDDKRKNNDWTGLNSSRTDVSDPERPLMDTPRQHMANRVNVDLELGDNEPRSDH